MLVYKLLGLVAMIASFLTFCFLVVFTPLGAGLLIAFVAVAISELGVGQAVGYPLHLLANPNGAPNFARYFGASLIGVGIIMATMFFLYPALLGFEPFKVIHLAIAEWVPMQFTVLALIISFGFGQSLVVIGKLLGEKLVWGK